MSSDRVTSVSQHPNGSANAPSRSGGAHAERMTELFNRYHSKLVKSLVAKTHSWDEARDIAAQAFTELLSLERPGAVNFFGAYLYRTARNLAEDRLRHRAMCDRKAPAAAYELMSASPSPEPTLVEEERLEILQRAINALRPRCRMALILRIYDELPYDDIVARFASHGIKLNERTVRRYVAEAFECCRQAILNAEGTAQGGSDE